MNQPKNADPSPPAAVPQRQLTLFDSTCIIVGIIIGAGIYRSSPDIARFVPSVGWLFAVWLLGGLLSFIGALCYAELATAYPKSGGDYVYLTRAFGRAVGFLFAWAQLWIIRPGSIGAMAYAFADYANSIWPQAQGPQARNVLLTYAGGSIVFFTAVNLLGVRQGKWTQNLLTSAKVLGLAAIVVVGLLLAAPKPPAEPATTATINATPSATKNIPQAETTDAKAKKIADVQTPDPQAEQAGPQANPPQEKQPADFFGRWFGLPTILAMLKSFSWDWFGLAMVFVLFTYGGWNEMAYVSAEVRNPNKNILRAMMLGTVAVAAIYLLVNYAFIHALGLEGARKSTAAADVLGLALGPWAKHGLALLVCISALGAVNGNIFTGARIYYALGTEHRLYSWLGRWNAKTGTPISSLLIQGLITLGLVLWFGPTERSAGGMESGFSKMIIFTTPPFWFFLTMVGLSVAELRWRDRDLARPYRVLWYPLPPIILCLFSMYMVYSSLKYAITNESWEAIWSVAILGLGVAMSFFDPPARAKE